MARMIDASRFGEILEQWKKDCLEDNDIQGADIISDVILQLDDMPTLTQPNEPTYPPAHIDREAWKPCDECKPSCKICDNYNAWDRYGKPQVCETCEEYSNIEPDDNYCANCGRPMTEESWKELEKRVRGENNGL